jgi:uroporphyrinogen III methyltransferase / synthase
MRTDPLHNLIALVGELAPGTVALVGAGPGDAALISIRGAARLMQADVVLHDHLIGAELLDLLRPGAECILVGKWRGQHVWTQDEINAALVQHARASRRVVRLKGGDPFVFGRGGEECLYLASAGIPYEVVPGITAAFGAPATAGIPLTHRGLSRSFVLVTGHADPDDPSPLDFAALARMETIAFYMGVRNLGANCSQLIAAGLDPTTPAAVIHWGTRPEQRTIIGTAADIAERVAGERIDPPAMVLIGKVVSLRDSIEWFERRPLHGRCVVVTRPRDQAAALSGPLAAAGAEVIEAPTIAVAPVEDASEVDRALRHVADYAWLVLTSANGVEALFERLEAMHADARALAGPKIAAVGPATAAALTAKGVRPDLIPPEAVGESIAELLIAEGVAGKRILLLRADIARRDLPATLTAAGAICDDLPIYRTICPPTLSPEFLQRLDAGRIDWITLTSPSAFQNLPTLLGSTRAEALHKIRLASIGPVTTKAVQAAGHRVAVEANPHDATALVAAIVAAEKAITKARETENTK